MKQKTAQFFLFLFSFTRELNLYSPLTYSLTSAHKLPPLPSTNSYPSSLRPLIPLSKHERKLPTILQLLLPRILQLILSVGLR